MPATEAGWTLAVEYRARQALAADVTARGLGAIWVATVDPDHLEATIPDFATAGAVYVEGGQHVAATLTDAFVSDYLWVETDEAHLPQGVDPGQFLGLEDTDAPISAVLAASAAYVRRALAQDRPMEEALDFGLSRATRLARSEVMGAGRRALAGLAGRTGRFSGWRRQTSSRPCRFCAALADGRIHPWSRKVSAHPNCSCTAIPVVRGLPERYLPATERNLEVSG